MTTPTPPLQKHVKAKQRRAGARVERTRNAGTMTEAGFWGMLRSGLRRSFRFWRPAAAALAASKRNHPGPRGQRFAYLCAACGKLHKRTNVQIDHRIPCGPLTCYEHLPAFVRNLTAEGPDAYQVLCKSCHNAKTNTEREFAKINFEKSVACSLPCITPEAQHPPVTPSVGASFHFPPSLHESTNVTVPRY